MPEKSHQNTVHSWTSLTTAAPRVRPQFNHSCTDLITDINSSSSILSLLLFSPGCSGLVNSELLDGLCLIPSAPKSLFNVIFWLHISPLTVVAQSFINEPCSWGEERLQIKLWMVCCFHAAVLHFEVAVKLPPCVDAVSARCSIQHVSHPQRRQCGHVSSHRSAGSHAHTCRMTSAAFEEAGWRYSTYSSPMYRLGQTWFTGSTGFLSV